MLTLLRPTTAILPSCRDERLFDRSRLSRELVAVAQAHLPIGVQREFAVQPSESGVGVCVRHVNLDAFGRAGVTRLSDVFHADRAEELRPRALLVAIGGSPICGSRATANCMKFVFFSNIAVPDQRSDTAHRNGSGIVSVKTRQKSIGQPRREYLRNTTGIGVVDHIPIVSREVGMRVSALVAAARCFAVFHQDAVLPGAKISHDQRDALQKAVPEQPTVRHRVCDKILAVP